MYRTNRRHLLAAVAGIRIPVGAFRRDAPGDGGNGGSQGGGSSGDGGQGGSGGGDGGAGDGGDGKPKPPNFDGDFDPERAKRALAASRDGEAKAKQRAQDAEKKNQDLISSIAVALGLKADPNTDPTELLTKAAKERDDAIARVRAQAIELAVFKSAGKAGGDPDALLDSRSFLKAVAQLDPDADDFGAKVTAAVKDAVKDNPKLAAGGTQGGQGPARQGADHSGGTGGRQRPAGLGAAIAARMTGGN